MYQLCYTRTCRTSTPDILLLPVFSAARFYIEVIRRFIRKVTEVTLEYSVGGQELSLQSAIFGLVPKLVLAPTVLVLVVPILAPIHVLIPAP